MAVSKRALNSSAPHISHPIARKDAPSLTIHTSCLTVSIKMQSIGKLHASFALEHPRKAVCNSRSDPTRLQKTIERISVAIICLMLGTFKGIFSKPSENRIVAQFFVYSVRGFEFWCIDGFKKN